MNRIDHYVELPEYVDLQGLISTADLFTKGMAGFFRYNKDLDRLETATLQISAGVFSILFSVNDLIASGYLVSAKILLRSIIDRMSTIAWLRCNGDSGLKVWERGWQHKDKDRPKGLSEKLECLIQFDLFEGDNSETLKAILEEVFLDILHGEVHGDLQSALRNTAIGGTSDGAPASGPNPFNIPEAVSLCKLLAVVSMQFLKEVQAAMPRLTQKAAA
jgi:hypothetical protein